MPFRTSLSFILGLLVIACASGCTAIKPPTSHIDPANSIGGLRSATLVYRVYSSSGASSMPDAVRVLSIKFPHPAGRAGYALAEAVVADLNHEAEPVKSPWAARLGNFARDTLPGMALGDGIKEAESLDIPTSRLKAALNRLGVQGYFDHPNRLPSPVELAVEVNGSQQDKPWRRVAELDQMLNEVRKGQPCCISAFRIVARTEAGPANRSQCTRASSRGRATAQWPQPPSAPIPYHAFPQLSRLPPVIPLAWSNRY